MLKFDINILWTIINLVVFYLLMKFFLFKPIKKVLDKRQQMIDTEIESARQTNAQAEEKMADYRQKIADYQTEGKEIIARAKSDAKQEYGKIIDRANDDARRMRQDAQKQIDSEIAGARRAAKEDIAALAMQAAETVVGATVNAATDSAIFDEFLNESSDK